MRAHTCARATTTRASAGGLLVLVTLGAAATAASVGDSSQHGHTHLPSSSSSPVHGANQRQQQQQQQQQQQHLQLQALASASSRAASFHQHQQHQQQYQRQIFQDHFTTSNTTNQSAALGHELHFGAKVALTILAGAVVLVASATFVDLNSSLMRASSKGSCDERSNNNVQSGNSAHDNYNHHHYDDNAHEPREQLQATARDQRSPSLSSHNSSTLFCSANSVASASVPILGRGHHGGGHFKRNLRLSLSKAAGSRSHNHHNQQQQQQQSSSNQQPNLLSPDWKEPATDAAHQQRRKRQPASGINGNSSRWLLFDAHLAKQLFLSFSLRNSASLIFQHQQQQQQNHDQPSTIDSLHGLRFLSMIWLIAMHSYSFAFRWMFFAKSPTLDDIYKTAASQLLANGTFACDSFLFAGGFLLPYLAFRQTNGAAEPAAAISEQQQQRQVVADASDSGCDHSRLRSAANGNYVATTTTIDTAAATTTTAAAAVLFSAPHDHECTEASAQQQQEHEQVTVATNSGSSSSNSAGCCTVSSLASADSALNSWHRNRELNTNELQMSKQTTRKEKQEQKQFTFTKILANLLHRYIRMMPLMMAIIGLSATLLRYLGEGPAWEDSTIMFDKWCRKNWWINALFMHNFINRETMCLSHSWYSAVDIQLFFIGQLILFVLFRSRKLGILLLAAGLFGAQILTGALTLAHHLPAVPQLASFSEQTMNRYYGEIYIKPYCRASPYLIGILLAYLMRTTSLGHVKLNKWQAIIGWTASISLLISILMAMQPAMNGRAPSELESALYSALSRPLWACATGWMIFACMTNNGGIFADILSARVFLPLSRLTYPAFLIHPIVMAVFYGSRQSSFEFSHYLMLYLILGNIVITYASAFVLSALFELPLLSSERAIKRALRRRKLT